jgi:flavin reductase (DIM6/NTAB) family NADH-FMN oxidoreductase RutF
MTHDPYAALGRIASGIFILTAGRGDAATGMLSSWVMQAGFEPPMVTVAVAKRRYVAEWLSAGEPFVLNIVGEGHKRLVRHFGRGFEPGEPAFDGLEVREGASGAPILTDALGYLECMAVSHVDSVDHRIFLAEVTGGQLSREVPPMIHIRKSGANY